MPLDRSERHVNNWELTARCLQLAGSHELHLDVASQVTVDLVRMIGLTVGRPRSSCGHGTTYQANCVCSKELTPVHVVLL
jgi:hypothetical protein